MNNQILIIKYTNKKFIKLILLYVFFLLTVVQWSFGKRWKTSIAGEIRETVHEYTVVFVELHDEWLETSVSVFGKSEKVQRLRHGGPLADADQNLRPKNRVQKEGD